MHFNNLVKISKLQKTSQLFNGNHQQFEQRLCGKSATI